MDGKSTGSGKFIGPFLVGLIGWGILFFGLDYASLALSGLSLMFTP